MGLSLMTILFRGSNEIFATEGAVTLPAFVNSPFMFAQIAFVSEGFGAFVATVHFPVGMHASDVVTQQVSPEEDFRAVFDRTLEFHSHVDRHVVVFQFPALSFCFFSRYIKMCILGI